jgi:hypothetical protein
MDPDFTTACKYYYAAENGDQLLLNTEYCECSLMEEKNPLEEQSDGNDLPRFYEQI